MTETARLVLAVDSREVDRGQRSLDGLTSKSRRAEQETERLSRATDQLSGAYRGLRNVLAAVGAGLAVRAVIRAADTYSELRSQLRLVTESQEELNETYEAAYRLAQETRGGLEETINLYARLARSSEELDLTNQQLLTVTRAINQSFVVSGASAQEAASATLQLSQGMASGTLRGEELNSVLENSPRLARAIADGLGVTIGQLRELGAEGQLTGSAVTRALLSSADSINREFQDMPRTVGQSLQQLRNDLIDTFGETDVSGFNDAIDDLRELVTDPNFKESVVTLGTAFATLIGTMASGASEVVNFTEYLGAELASKINGVAADDIPRLERELAGLEKQLDASFLEKDIGLVFTSDEEIKRKIEEVRERLQIAYDLQQSFNQGFGNTNPDQGGGDPPEPLGGDGDDKAAKAIQKRVAALQLEAETLGMTARQAELYRLEVEGASPAQLQAADAAYQRIDAFEAEQRAFAKFQEQALEFEKEFKEQRATDLKAGEAVLEEYMTEEEQLRNHHERRLEILEAAREADYENEGRWNEAILAENERFQKAMNNVTYTEMLSRNQLASNMLTQLSGLMSSKYRAFFEIGKAAALANIAVRAPEKAHDAAAWGMKLGGPPLAAAFTAGSWLVSAAQAAQVASTNFNGGGGVSGSGPGGGISGGVNTVPAAPAPVQVDGAGTGGGNNLTVVFEGDVSGIDQDTFLDSMANKLKDKLDTTDFVLVESRSRNGRMLMGR